MTSTHTPESSSPLVLKTDKRGRVRTPSERREALLDAFEAGAMSGAEFARHHGLAYPTFMAWVAARRRKSAPPKPRRGLFQEIVLAPGDVHGAEGVGLEVELPGGARMRIGHPDQVRLAAALLRAMGSGPC